MIVNVEDLRRRARARIPRTIFDFIDGGAGDEHTLADNRADLDNLRLSPRSLTNVGSLDTGTMLWDRRLELPLVIAPMGLCGIALPKGELVAARAAVQAGVGYCLSVNATTSLEEVSVATSSPFWFQMYMLRDRDLMCALMERARGAGCDALVVTTDLAVQGRRERDMRNGFTIPPRIGPSELLRLLAHPGWLFSMARGPRPVFANFDTRQSAMGLARFISNQFNPAATWTDLEAVRRAWGGRLIVKGILRPDDARRAMDAGADGIVVSNHGGRQLDDVLSSIAALPAVANAVNGRVPVLLDGGVRRAADVIRAKALGAQACMIGRPVLYALAGMGRSGPAHLLAMLRDELNVTLALLGVPRFDDVDPSVLATRAVVAS